MVFYVWIVLSLLISCLSCCCCVSCFLILRAWYTYVYTCAHHLVDSCVVLISKDCVSEWLVLLCVVTSYHWYVWRAAKGRGEHTGLFPIFVTPLSVSQGGELTLPSRRDIVSI